MAKSLLVIDDSSTIREAIQLALTGGEWELVTATNGTEAMAALQQHRVDAILCDIALGDEDGYELCRSLGASAEGSGIPTLLMGGTVNATAALAVGASATLPKPFTSEQLQQILQETMEQSDFSFDFDDAQGTVADEAPLELEPMAGGFELPPVPETHDSLEVEEIGEIEVIDLSDDDEFEDLELLDDLQPVELTPIEQTAADDLPGTLDLEATAAGEHAIDAPVDLDLDELLAEPSVGLAAEAFDDVPMEIAPEPPSQAPADGQEQDAGWTVDGLMLGGDEQPPAGPGGEDQPLASSDSGVEFAEPLPITGSEPDLSGDVEPTLPDPFPAFAEEAQSEADPAPSEAGEVGPAWAAELTPLEEEEGETAGTDMEPEPAIIEIEPVEEPEAGGLDVDLDVQAPAPVRADSYSDLEQEWAREAAPSAEDTSPAEEEAAAAHIDMGKPLQPESSEPSAETLWPPGPEVPLDHDPEAADSVPESGAMADSVPEQAAAAGAWDLALGTGDAPLEATQETDQFPQDELLIDPLSPSMGTEATSDPAPDVDPLTADLDALAAEMGEPAEPEDLAASVAAGAGRAVREALEQSLSAEHLAPLIAAAVERVAWEVVPQLAERLIRETIAKLQEDPPTP